MLAKDFYAAVRETRLPDEALLARYRSSAGYVDCFMADMPRKVPLVCFVQHF